MSADLLMQLAGIFAGGAGVYAAIRGDLAKAVTKAEQALLDASKAHDRLDVHIENHKG